MSARDDIVESIRRELLGPSDPTETLEEPPTSRYLIGMLAPSGTEVGPTEDEVLEAAEGDQETSSGDPTPTASLMEPSSIGLSFLVDPDTQVIRCSAAWGRYEPRRDGQRVRWNRVPQSFDTDVSLDVLNTRQKQDLTADGGIRLQWIIRPLGNLRAVSLFLVNAQTPLKSGRDERWMFQPELTIRSSSTSASPAPFHAREETQEAREQALMSDADLQSLALLYRTKRTFAVGHGVAADWSTAADPNRATEMNTVIMPTRVTPTLAPWRGLDLDMRKLAEVQSAAAVSEVVSPLIDRYAEWIAQQRSTMEKLSSRHRTTAQIHMNDCAAALQRMRSGLELIGADGEVFQAFRFANKAMLLQRAHVRWAKDFRRTGTRDPSGPTLEAAWYPFQLAFILLNIDAIANPGHPDRLIGDLLWFPTGGGKTEAYLGLAALTMALRRLHRHADRGTGAGVSVLMRYTLRLLTIQQFQRAASMICACEVLREAEPDTWGATPFTVGLWVGASTTPNSFEDSDRALTDLLKDPSAELDVGSPMQLSFCPWCGEELRVADYRADRTLQKTLVWCPRSACEFSKHSRSHEPCGIPVVTVDEEIYRTCPSLVVGTVDKFARMPWRGETQALFGRVNRLCERHGYLTTGEPSHPSHRPTRYYPAAAVHGIAELSPPDLVIQDELHLITGPLGSLVGLYETAVDWLSCLPVTAQGSVGPKLIASTATIRRATEQMRRLYRRELRTFPPPGLDADDSFFAVLGDEAVAPGRVFIGLFAPGKSGKTAIARAYAASLAAAQASFIHFGVTADPYMTLVGYFNSLRELGGTVRLVEDDIPSWLVRIANRGGSQRQIVRWRELTSRVGSPEIPGILDDLDLVFGGAGEPVPLDIVLATNMISVGMDVTRLGLMVVAGQPKTTAEYIQATSRVGRQYPGLVINVYNWSRSRDISHYERFRPYHDALYRYVEGVSVTPYASRARDRALHAVMVSMIRLGIDGMAAEEQASAIEAVHSQVSEVVRGITDRSRDVADVRTSVQTARELTSLLDSWTTTALAGSLRYSWRSQFRPAPGPVLLRSAEEAEGDGLWRTLNSLRDVEPEAGVYLWGSADGQG